MNETGAVGRTFDPFSREVLEFPAVVELLRGFLSGPLSEPLLETLKPQRELERARRDLERAREAREFLRESPRPGLGGLTDPRPLLEKLRVEGAALTALEILALVELAKAGLDIRRLLANTPAARLDELVRGLADFRDLVTELDGKILPDGTLDSSASPALARIRRSIERLRQEVQASLERLVRRLAQDRVLQDAVVTLRNDRFVIPVRVEEKRRVAGVVHGASSSGATVYIEPLETVPLNNELVELQDREFAEIQRLLGEFSRKLRARREELASAAQILSELDLAFAKAEFGRQYDCCIPEWAPCALPAAEPAAKAGPLPGTPGRLGFGASHPGMGGAERVLLLREVRHPLLEKALRSQGRKPVPLTIELQSPKTLMVISGPNTGGKTVALKTLGIAVLMAQAGIPVPASEARLPRFGRVLADIGDQQSIEANLSTFSAHMTNIQGMAEAADSSDLVLLDELGASTEPNEGAALAIAILEHFRQRGAMAFASTHHSRLKAYAAETPEAINAAMDFDEATLQPTYRLLIGLPGKSSALDIAGRLGVEPSIVERARALLHPADAEAAGLLARLHEQRAEFEQRLAALAAERGELAAERQELERKFQQERRAKLRELDARLEETLRQCARNWEQTVEELRRQAAPPKVVAKAERKAAGLHREAREEWNAQVLEAIGAALPQARDEEPAPSPDRPLAVGDQVQVANVSTPGTVTALVEGDGVEVAVGSVRMRVRRHEVRVISSVSSAPMDRGSRPEAGTTDVPEEFNVIGNTAEEARERVDKFLDQAYLAGRYRLRIIHGHGKGVLRKTLHEMFASHPHVERFYPAPPHEGGSGATIVELKS
jgi:DNA mismatch repair protein MutS2